MEEKKNAQKVCPYAKKCGGCQYQGIPYPAQLKKKHNQVQSLHEKVWNCETGNWDEGSLFLPE